MKSKYFLLMGFMAFCLLALVGKIEAKELIFNLGYGKVQVIDGEKDQLLPDIDIKGWGREANFSADKNFMYVTASRHWIHKIDLKQMKVVKTIDMHSGGWDRFIYGMELLADGKTAYIHFMSRKTSRGEAVVGTPTVAQIDLENGQILRSIDVPWGVAYLALMRDGKMLYAVGQDIIKIDVSGKEMKKVGEHPMFDKNMNILPLFSYAEENDGVALMPYWIGEAGGLLSVDKNNGKITETPIKGGMMAYGALYSPDMKKAYANMDELYVIDLATKSITNTEVVPTGTTFAIMTSADGKKIYLQGGPTISIYDAQTLKVMKVLNMSTDGMLLRRITL